MSEIFIIKNTGKGIINSLAPENVIPIKSAGSSNGGVITKDSDTVAFTGNGTAVNPLTAKVKDVYSTTETLTGGTWIDGKPIYRKVFITMNFTETTIDLTELNIEKFVFCNHNFNYSGVFQNTNHYYFARIEGANTYKMTDISTVYFTNLIDISQQSIETEVGSGVNNQRSKTMIDESRIIIEYTKTTD